MVGRPRKVVANVESNENVVEEKVEKKVIKRKTSEEKAAEKKAEAEEKAKNLIDSIYGDLMDMTESEDHFFPSGSLIIDSVLSNGKGIPLGKFISLNAESGVGKSSACLHIARNCCSMGYHCLYIDTECGLNRSQLESFSMIPFLENRTFFPKYIRTYRELDDLLSKVQKDPNLKFIFIDSLTDIVPDQYIDNNISDINQPALEAVCQSRILKKYKYPLSQAGITVFFVLQNRTKIAMGYGQQTTVQAAGGKAVVYHMDITLELTKKDSLTRPVKGHDKPIPYGAECFLKANKNRYAPPMIPMQIQIIFGKGVSNSSAVANALILNGIAKTPTKAKYVVDYQGEEVTCTSKAKFDEFVKSHLEYYKKIVESCGGICLLPESELQQPNDVLAQEEINNSDIEIEKDNDSVIELEIENEEETE